MSDELTPVFTDVRMVSEWCAKRPPFMFPHSTELCDDGAAVRKYFYDWTCECECHQP